MLKLSQTQYIVLYLSISIALLYSMRISEALPTTA